MNGFVVKVHMTQVKPRTLVLLQSVLSGSALDSENLIVHLEELNSTLSGLEENNETSEFLKGLIKTIDNEAKYIWFYL